MSFPFCPVHSDPFLLANLKVRLLWHMQILIGFEGLEFFVLFFSYCCLDHCCRGNVIPTVNPMQINSVNDLFNGILRHSLVFRYLSFSFKGIHLFVFRVFTWIKIEMRGPKQTFQKWACLLFVECNTNPYEVQCNVWFSSVEVETLGKRGNQKRSDFLFHPAAFCSFLSFLSWLVCVSDKGRLEDVLLVRDFLAATLRKNT